MPRTQMRSRPGSLRKKSLAPNQQLPGFFSALVLLSISSLVVLLMYEEVDLIFLMVITLSGALGAADAISALQGQRDILSLRSLVSFLLLHTSYTAPLMHVTLESYPKFLALPMDMHQAFAEHAVLQLLCVAVYFISIRCFSPAQNNRAEKQLNAHEGHSRRPVFISRWLIITGLVSLLLFVFTVLAAGGPASWLNSQLNYREGLSTSGWIISLAEAFPSLFFMGYLVKLEERGLTRKQLLTRVFWALAVLVLVTFITSGLRGSRANLVWPTLSAVLMIHLFFYRFKLRIIVLVAILGVLFASFYNVYKKGGVEGIQEVQAHGLEDYSATSDYSFGVESVLMNDFSRSAMQAILLDRWKNESITPHYGATYIGDFLLFVPGAEESSTFPNKSLAATDILYGPGAAQYTDRFSTRIYGLQGEALMNFGPVGAVLVFVPFAFVVVSGDRLMTRAKTDRSLPHVILFSVVAPAIMLLYLSDLDNVLRNLTSNALLPALALLMASLAAKTETKKMRAVRGDGR